MQPEVVCISRRDLCITGAECGCPWIRQRKNFAVSGAAISDENSSPFRVMLLCVRSASATVLSSSPFGGWPRK
jgi:hypothetical protein